MGNKTRRYYSPEFKQEAIELASQPGATVAGVARDLGIHANLIRRWRDALTSHGKRAFVGQGVARDEELARLRRELALVKKERDFLKSAAAYFAKDAR
jgi:transposase